MLHNICKDRNLQIPDGDDLDLVEDDQQALAEPQPQPQPAAGRPREGLQYRDQFAALHFKYVSTLSMFYLSSVYA